MAGALVEVTDFFYSKFSSDEKCTGVFLDLAKKFYMVKHNLLLNKIQVVGVRIDLALIKSYPSEGFQRLKINILSDYRYYLIFRYSSGDYIESIAFSYLYKEYPAHMARSLVMLITRHFCF